MTDSATLTRTTESIAPRPRLWSASGRHGASLVAVLLGGYLLMRTQLSIAVIQPAEAVEVITALVLQFLVAAAILVAGAMIAPASLTRRVIAVAVIVAGLGVHAAGLATVSASTPDQLVYALLPTTVGAFTATATWLIVRGRSWPTLLPLAAFALVPALNERLSSTGWSGVVRDELTIVAAAAIGVGVVWLAAAIDHSRGKEAALAPTQTVEEVSRPVRSESA
ncbi:hypothetical protein KXS11_07940 [Plantibacter flavus]|uniref:hypothetical protein n=1 Tax=Plantibacter flavus TaxID=150123 RepID=UPI003F1768DE